MLVLFFAGCRSVWRVRRRVPGHYRRAASGDPSSILTARARRVKQATWTRPADGEKVEVAVKIIKRKALKGDIESVFAEVHVLEGLEHPNIGASRLVLPKLSKAVR